MGLRLGDGLMVMLGPAQVTTAPMSSGCVVRVHAPGGSMTERTVTSVHVCHSVVGLFFERMREHEVPKGACIELGAVA